MKYFPKLDGYNIYLSPMNLEDASVYVKWLNDSIISESIGIEGKIITLNSVKKWLTENSNNYNFIMLDQVNGKTYQVQWSQEAEKRIVVPIE